LAFITGSVARAGAGERWSTPKDRLNISSEGARAIVKRNRLPRSCDKNGKTLVAIALPRSCGRRI
jgi:hypothetical protein